MRSILIAERDEWVSQLFAEAFLPRDWRMTTYHDGLLVAKTLDGPVNYHAVLLSNRWEGVGGVIDLRGGTWPTGASVPGSRLCGVASSVPFTPDVVRRG